MTLETTLLLYVGLGLVGAWAIGAALISYSNNAGARRTPVYRIKSVTTRLGTHQWYPQRLRRGLLWSSWEYWLSDMEGDPVKGPFGTEALASAAIKEDFQYWLAMTNAGKWTVSKPFSIEPGNGIPSIKEQP